MPKVKIRELIIDSFAGGGGASLGISWATGSSPDIAVNHDAEAIAMHARNHPETLHLQADVFSVNPRKVTKGRKVGLLWASPDCRDFSRAKGGQPVSRRVRGLAWVVVKWAKEVRPRVIILENVREFETWGPLVPLWRCTECNWRGTEGQATLIRTRRRCPRCESKHVRETSDMVRNPDKIGLNFKIWVGRLRGLGYRVEWKVLNAADYGAPTNRKRLFLVARCDGQPIIWPEPSHSDPKKIETNSLFIDERRPWRTAAECIDWSIPCPSIFDRKKPLKEKTLRRIAMGIVCYVLQSPNPFVVPVTHVGDRRVHPVDEPLPTITRAHRGEFAVVAPTLIRQFGNSVGQPVDQPAPTETANPKTSLLTATLVQTGYGERKGQRPRSLDLEQPLGTVVSGGQKHALVTGMLAKFYGGVVGTSLDAPIGTITSIDHHMLASANLVRFNHGEKQWHSVEEPLGVVTTQGNKFGLVYAFLVKYYGTAIGQPLDQPLDTLTDKARFAVVQVEIKPGVFEPAVSLEVPGIGRCVIADLGLRMLKPRELARAQGFPDTYELSGCIRNDVSRIGNSVSPFIAQAMVKVNFKVQCETEVANA